MTQIFDTDGNVIPVTVIDATPNTVTQVKSDEKDGYTAVQVGVGTRKEKNVNKPQQTKGLFMRFVEFKFPEAKDLSVGSAVEVASFAEGDTITVSAISKGKGFQGVVKRHGFHGGPASHGQKHSHREPGSIGATGPARVFKGIKMAGRMGGDRITVKNLKVLQVNKEENVMVVKGAIPGRRGTLVEVRGINKN